MKEAAESLAGHVAGKGTITYTIRLPLDVAARYEADAARRNIAPTAAVTQGAVRGSFIMPKADEDLRDD